MVSIKAYREIVELTKDPIKIFLSDTKLLQDDIKSHPHWHPLIEILFFKKGSAILQIDGNVFNAKKNDIVIIGYNQIHSTYSVNNSDCSILVFQFYLDEFSILNKIKFTNVISEDNNHWSKINTILSNLLYEYNNYLEQSVFEIKSNLYQLISLVVKNKRELYVEENSFNKNKDIITEIFDYIDSNYMNNFTIEDISKHCHFSVPHFMRIFKNATGYTFKHYLNFYRINKSEKLLLQGVSVSKTARECGFDNLNTFIRLFKTFKGTTPTGYVKNRL